jgi:hypothetical protein
MLGGEAAGCLGGGMGFAAAIELLFAIGICLIGLLYGTPPHFRRIWNIDLRIRRSGGIQRCNESVACLRKKRKRVILSDGRFLSSSNLVNVFGNKKEAGESLLIG